MHRAVLPAVLATLALARPASAADPVPVQLLHDRDVQAIELSGADVLVASQPIEGPLTLTAIPRTGGKPRTLLRVAHPGFGELGLSASAERVALVVDIDGKPDEHRVYTGPPSGPLRLVRRTPDPWEPGIVRVDGNRMLLTESVPEYSFDDDDDDTGPSRFRAMILDGSAWTPITWASGNRIPVAIAGPYAAVHAYAPERIEVVDLASGATLYTIPAPAEIEGPYFGGLDLQPDGRIAVNSRRGIDLAGLTQPVSNLANSGRLGNPHFAGGYIATFDDARNTLALMRGDGTETVLGPPSLTEGDIAADDEGVAWLLNGCVRYASFSPTAKPSSRTPCPSAEISLYIVGAHSKLHGDHARVPIKCVAAAAGRCRGELLLRERRTGPVVGRGRFSLRPAPKDAYVKVHFTAAAVAKFKRKHGGYLIVDPRVQDGTVGTFDGIADFEFDVNVD